MLSCVFKSAFEITVGQRSLTVVTAFVTAEKLRRTVTMTTNNNDFLTIMKLILKKWACYLRQIYDYNIKQVSRNTKARVIGTCMYASSESHKRDFSIEVLNLD